MDKEQFLQNIWDAEVDIDTKPTRNRFPNPMPLRNALVLSFKALWTH